MGDNRRFYLTLAVVFIVGLLIGWFIFGWWLAPVEWTNATLQDLSPDQQKIFILTESEAFALTQDAGAAQQRLQNLGSKDYVGELTSQAIGEAETRGDVVAADRMRAMAASLGLPLAAATQPETPAEEGSGRLQGICTAGLGLVVVLGGIALVLWLLTRNRRRPSAAGSATNDEPSPSPVATATPGEWVPAETAPVIPVTPAAAADHTPVAREFRADYHQGEPSYDQSFDIESPSGAYLGECGMTASELVNGDPNRVTALEVWLFDKSDIRTVTKVLMSDYAFGNQALRDKLSTRGDAALLTPGMGFVLDAQSLRLEGKVLSLDYADGDAPSRSTIRSLSVQLRVIRQAA